MCIRDSNNKPLPRSGREAFEYAIRFNCNEHEEEENDVLCPLELFRDICKDFVSEFREAKRQAKLAAYSIISTEKNVISVDFGGRNLAQTG